MSKTICVLNLGSTSSKVAIFEDNVEMYSETIRHDPQMLARTRRPVDQMEFRRNSILSAVHQAGYHFASFDAICSRAGVLRPIESGTYTIDYSVMADVLDPEVGGRGPHGLGILIANEISMKYDIPGYFCDPVSTDELKDIARITGFKGMERKSHFHALNQKAVARRCAEEIGKPYEELNLIGVHLGGGTSVVAHEKGKCIEIHNCTEEGAFSMDRCGNLPTSQVVNYCFSGTDKDEVRHKLGREGGVFSYLGTSDMREVEQRMKDGDKEAKEIYEAFAYQHSKCIGEMAAALRFDVDGIFITGGIAHRESMIDLIKGYVGKLAPIYVFPGEEEMKSLAEGALRVLNGEEKAHKYQPKYL